MRSNCRYKLLAFVLLVFVLPPSFVNAVDIDTSQNQDRVPVVLPALGVSETFGRWNKVVKLGYNPAGAPAVFANTEQFLSLLTEAAQRWEKVSGIKFEILPAGNYINDRPMPRADRDGVVSVTWVETDESFGGQAGPLFGSYDGRLKYTQYEDGTIELKSNTTWSGSTRLTRVMVHEIGHLIGLGHSENPQSLMFADPYNQLQYPTEDDIRAIQTLYGPPSTPLNASQTVTAWQFQAPSLARNSISQVPPAPVRRYELASEAKTQYLFKPNQNSSIYGKGVMLVLNTALETAVTKINSATSSDSYLAIYAPIGNWNSTEPISLDAKIILVNPLGYINYEREWKGSCKAQTACVTNQTLNWNRSIKDVPGEWTIYVIENPATHQNPELLYKTTFTVEGDNKPVFSIKNLTAGETTLVNNRITESTSNDVFLRVHYQLNNNWSAVKVERKVELVLTDPKGYIYSKTNGVLSCGAVSSCSSWISSLQTTEVLKTLPGKWTIYVNDTDTNEMLHKMDFVVDTNPVFNKSPTARVIVSAADHPNRIKVKVIANDVEGDTISIVWGQFDNPEVLGADGISQWKTFDFGGSGARTLFIQINDNSVRYAGRTGPGSYSYAGSGFQTLIRLDLTLPLTSSNHVAVTSSSVIANNNTTSNLLTYIPSYTPSPTWPAPYNGITSPKGKDLPYNNIGVVKISELKLYACVRILKSGLQSNLNGVERFDINFKVVNLDRGDIQVTDARPFNEMRAVNEAFEAPECSGQFDTATGVYSDFIVVGGDLFKADFKVLDEVNLVFSLVNAVKIQ
jgi:hypothetical protein